MTSCSMKQVVVNNSKDHMIQFRTQKFSFRVENMNVKQYSQAVLVLFSILIVTYFYKNYAQLGPGNLSNLSELPYKQTQIVKLNSRKARRSIALLDVRPGLFWFLTIRYGSFKPILVQPPNNHPLINRQQEWDQGAWLKDINGIGY